MEDHRKARGQRGLGQAGRVLLEQAQATIAERAPLTVRGICYKLFVDGWISSMEVKNTQRISRLTVWGREHGVIEWNDIVDETREVERAPMWRDLKGFASAIEYGYRKDYWTAQSYNVQVWSEKATVGGIIRPVTREYGVPFLPVHGFGSATKVHEVAEQTDNDPRHLVILYVGDHDPSGMYMSEVDLPKRLERYGAGATIHRIALTPEDLPAIPPFPAKQKDPRYKWYKRHYGERAWELDGMDPNELRERVENRIREYIDWGAWERMRSVEAAEIETVREVAQAMGK